MESPSHEPPRTTQCLSSVFLPEELLLEILYHASPKTLLRCASVCKSWHSLIHSPSFISAHLSRRLQNPNNPNSPLLLFRVDRTSDPGTYSFASDFGTPHFTHLSPLHFPIRENNNHLLSGVTFCSGLICVPDFWNFNLTLWNPSIRKWRVVPFPVVQIEDLEIFGLGFDSRENDFKVLRILCSDIDFWIYSSNSNSWKDISDLAPLGLDEYHCAAGCVLSGNGYLNFIGGVERWFDENRAMVNEIVNCTVVGFDFNANVFHETAFPDCLRELALEEVSLSMMAYGEASVALVCGFVRRGVYDVWGLGVYGDANSWKRLYKIRDTMHEIRGWVFRETGELLLERTDEKKNIVSGESEDGQIVLSGSGRGIIVCDPKTKQVDYLVNWSVRGFSYVGPFVESLVLLDAQDEVEDEEEDEDEVEHEYKDEGEEEEEGEGEDEEQILAQALISLSQVTSNGAHHADDGELSNDSNESNDDEAIDEE